jgi:hypothetical protein
VAQFVRNPIFLSLNQDYWKKVLRWLSLPGMVAQFGAEYPVDIFKKHVELFFKKIHTDVGCPV